MEQGRLDLDAPIATYLPAFRKDTGGKVAFFGTPAGMINYFHEVAAELGISHPAVVDHLCLGPVPPSPEAAAALRALLCTPPELPVTEPPMEDPVQQPPEIDPVGPDTVEPGRGPDEMPTS